MNADHFPSSAATETSGGMATPDRLGIALSAAPFPPGQTLHAFRSVRRSAVPPAAGEAEKAPLAYAVFAAIVAVASILLVIFTAR